MSDDPLLLGFARALALRKAVFGRMDHNQKGHTGPLAFHRAIRRCPFCGDLYQRHAGFVDHRDRCDPDVPTKDTMRGNDA
jgi:hypothetical protein